MFLSLLIGIQFLSAQVPSNCNVNPILQDYYDVDVKYLALKRIYDLQAPEMDSIVIPQSYQDTIFEAMAAVFNLTNHSARDTVFDLYCIHQYLYNYISYNIVVRLDSSCTWLSQWQNLITTTGVPDLDTLLSTYGFTVTDFLPQLNLATLTTNLTLNVSPVCDSIETFMGVKYADFNCLPGDGDWIGYSRSGNGTFLSFGIGYGDCPAGCTGKKEFRFQVFDDCSVLYLGSEFFPAPGFSFPAPVNCNISMGMNNPEAGGWIQVFPNPVRDFLKIRTDHNERMEYEIFNSSGQSVFSGQLTTEADISTKHMAPGIYFVKFSGDLRQTTLKVIISR